MSLQAPRVELPLTDASGQISREWYKFFVSLAKANGPSTSTSDDAAVRDETSHLEAVAYAALAAARNAEALRLFDEQRPSLKTDDLLAWWPGETK